METYINGVGAISPQDNTSLESLESAAQFVGSKEVKCLEPDYKEFFSPAAARRMSRMVKFSMAAAMNALRMASIEKPDAILTGTAMGCLQDTEKFLNAIIDNDEQFLTPTAFIQSTHNTVGAQIALFLKCFAYNFTYVQRGLSFETALVDALMLLNEGEGKQILVGGHDEMTKDFYTLYNRLDYWKKEPIQSLLNTNTEGYVSGEGSAFFVLSNERSEKSLAKIKEVQIAHNPKDLSVIHAKLDRILEENKDIDVVFYGLNGDVKTDKFYQNLGKEKCHHIPGAYFKHWCGEYGTASSYALFLASLCLRDNRVPSALKIDKKVIEKVKKVLIVNAYREQDYSFILLENA